MTAQQAYDLGYEAGHQTALDMELDSDSTCPAMYDALVDTAISIEKEERALLAMELSPENLRSYDRGVISGARDGITARIEPADIHEPEDRSR